MNMSQLRAETKQTYILFVVRRDWPQPKINKKCEHKTFTACCERWLTTKQKKGLQ